MEALRPVDKVDKVPGNVGPSREKPPFVSAFESELDHVYRTFRRFGFSEIDAEDLSQEVFLIMWRRWDEYDPDRPLRAWLAGISFRVAQHHRRKRREVLDAGLLDQADEAAGPYEHLTASRARALVLTALDRLPERHRSALVMSDLDGLTMPAVAEALSVPLATAYTRVRRARLAFADEVARLQKSGPEPRSESRAGLLSVEALLIYERPAPPVRAEIRQRIEARAQTSLSRPLPASPRPLSPRPAPPRTALSSLTWLSLGAAGIVAVITGAALLMRPKMTAAAHAPAAAGAGVTPAATAPTALGQPGRLPRRVPPRLASADLSTGAQAQHLARGLTGYWRFDGGEGGSNDLSSNARECQVRGLDPARAFSPEGVHGGALALRGRGWLDCTVGDNDTAVPRELTIAAWVRPNRPVTYHRSIVSREINGSNHDDFFLGFEGSSLKASSKAWAGNAKIPYPLTPGRWTHIAFSQVADGVVVLYVDGVEAARNQVRLHRSSRGTRRLLIGAGYGSKGGHVGQKFHGMIDELVIYDRALGPGDIAALASGTQPALSD